MSEENNPNVQVIPEDKSKTKHIWKIAIYLGIITSFEFLMAFTMPRGAFLTTMFIFMTLFKAFFIVAEFMHLKHEVKALKWSIIVPIVFLFWLIIALLVEGNHIFHVRF